MTTERPHSGVTISLASLGAFIPVALAAWFLIKPSVVVAVNNELQAQVQHTVSQQVRPINTALGIILENDIENIKAHIAQMEYKRDFPPPNDWTSKDVADLSTLRKNLSTAEAALKALRMQTRTS